MNLPGFISKMELVRLLLFLNYDQDYKKTARYLFQTFRNTNCTQMYSKIKYPDKTNVF